MCGIFGYVGFRDSIDIVIKGLKRLEYRGYDSAGIAGISNGKVQFCKEAGKVSMLEEEIKNSKLALECVIGQTRWATHGKPSKVNAHPHLDVSQSLAVVHNGIIENYEVLKKSLQDKGIEFLSQTDTEVVAHLIGDMYEGDLLKTLHAVASILKGSFALAIIHKDYPDQIFGIAHESPLAIGIGSGEAFISSDSNAFAGYTQQAIFLSHAEIAILGPNKLEIYDASFNKIEKEAQNLSEENKDISKGQYEHYTLKEIHEQPQTIKNALLSRYIEEYGTALFEELSFSVSDLLATKRILILGCGTSYHAGLVASYMLEDRARIPVEVEISSEFRYKNPIIDPGTFVIAISQSGETADTIAAIREIKAKGGKILAISNVQDSTLARESDSTIFLRAGPEIGVCSTKAFTSQLVVLTLFVLLMSRIRHMNKQDGIAFVHAMKLLPDQVQAILDNSKQIEELAKKYAKYDNFFFLGRNYMYPISLEGALKLKEISYINANGYPAGEMKHGPIALINENCPSVAFCAHTMTFDKLLGNLMEIKARNGLVLAIAEESEKGLEGIADDIIRIPDTLDELTPITSIVAAQLFAYYIAKLRGAEIDQPRNLAKSVTVE